MWSLHSLLRMHWDHEPGRGGPSAPLDIALGNGGALPRRRYEGTVHREGNGALEIQQAVKNRCVPDPAVVLWVEACRF